MEPATIITELDLPEADYQRAALDAAVAQPEAMTPPLLARLEAVAADPESWRADDGAGLLYTLVLLAHFREPAAHEPLLRLARHDELVIEALLGDAVTELLSALLWQTAGGETASIRELLEDRSAYGLCRDAAADAMVMAVLFGDQDRREVLQYLAALLAEEDFAEPGDSAWRGVFHAMLDLYPDDHGAFLRRWLQLGHLSYFEGSERDLDDVLHRGMDAHLATQRQRTRAHLPDDIHGYLSHWAGFQPGYRDQVARQAMDAFEGAPMPHGLVGVGSHKPRPPTPAQKKRKRKQQKQSRKSNRKRKK